MQNRPLIVMTGVSRGLGRALSQGFATAGATVVGCSRSDSEDKHSFAPGGFSAVDVSDAVQVEQWAQRTIEEFGPPDLLINCAAIINRNAPLWEIRPDEFEMLVAINIRGVHNAIYSFVPAMIARGRGVVVNFSSYWGRSTSPDVAAYCASKWAVEGLTRGLADDLPGGMAAVAFNPGVIHTDMLASCFAEGAATYPSPEEWAETAVPYLLSLGPEDNGQSVTTPGF